MLHHHTTLNFSWHYYLHCVFPSIRFWLKYLAHDVIQYIKNGIIYFYSINTTELIFLYNNPHRYYYIINTWKGFNGEHAASCPGIYKISNETKFYAHAIYIMLLCLIQTYNVSNSSWFHASRQQRWNWCAGPKTFHCSAVARKSRKYKIFAVQGIIWIYRQLK